MEKPLRPQEVPNHGGLGHKFCEDQQDLQGIVQE